MTPESGLPPQDAPAQAAVAATITAPDGPHGRSQPLPRGSGIGGVALVLGCSLLAEPVLAQSMLSLESTPLANGGSSWSVPVQTLLFFTALSFLPAAVLMMTSFTRIIIVLSLVRQAVGLPTAPPNQVLIGIALFMTAFVMAPTLDRIYQDAYLPLSTAQISAETAIERAAGPLRTFMLAQTRDADLALFLSLSRGEAASPALTDEESATGSGTAGSLDAGLNRDTVPFHALVPAFVVSELKTAFQIGFMVYIPFIIIDMVVACVLMAMGMMMVPPVMVSLPFKLVLFVLADGWNVLIGSLVASFSPG